MAVLATDNFNRANADPIGTPWATTGDSQHFTIASNVATPASLVSDAGAFENTVTWPNDQYSQAQLTVTGTGAGGTGLGVGVRMASGINYYRVVTDHGVSNNVELAKLVGGSYTQIWQRTQSWTDGDTFYIEAQGTAIVVKRNG